MRIINCFIIEVEKSIRSDIQELSFSHKQERCDIDAVMHSLFCKDHQRHKYTNYVFLFLFSFFCLFSCIHMRFLAFFLHSARFDSFVPRFDLYAYSGHQNYSPTAVCHALT